MIFNVNQSIYSQLLSQVISLSNSPKPKDKTEKSRKTSHWRSGNQRLDGGFDRKKIDD